jgi:hypothetical protein
VSGGVVRDREALGHPTPPLVLFEASGVVEWGASGGSGSPRPADTKGGQDVDNAPPQE